MDPFKKSESFYEETFSHVNSTDMVIRDKEFEKCTFRQCSFINCQFVHCKFLDCTFDTSDLSVVKLTDSIFSECVFVNSKAIGIDWTKAKTLRSLSFKSCQLHYSNFSFLKLPQLKLLSCTVHEADFMEANLTEGDFKGTDFTRSRFANTNLTKANFKNAYNYSINFNNNLLTKAKFSLPEAVSLLQSLDIILE